MTARFKPPPKDADFTLPEGAAFRVSATSFGTDGKLVHHKMSGDGVGKQLSDGSYVWEGDGAPFPIERPTLWERLRRRIRMAVNGIMGRYD